MGRAVLLLHNADKPEVADALPEVRRLVASAGGRVVAEHAAMVDGALTDARGAELVVVLGGDGTLLTQAQRCAALDLPMLGVNLGHVGYLAEFDLPALREQAGDLFCSGPLRLVERAMLVASVARASPSSPPIGARTGLNDCVVTAGPPFRMIALSISIDAQPGPTVSGDGLIVATPVGTTAYNASAGGPIIAPDVRALAITPIAAHSLSFRPVVVSGSSTVDLTLLRVNSAPTREGGAQPGGQGEGTTLVVDGQLVGRLFQGDRVAIRLAERPLRFVQNPRSQYWQTLIRKMNWATPPQSRTA